MLTMLLEQLNFPYLGWIKKKTSILQIARYITPLFWISSWDAVSHTDRYSVIRYIVITLLFFTDLWCDVCRIPVPSACCFCSPLQSPSPLVWKGSICILRHMGPHMVCLRMLMLRCRRLRLGRCCPPVRPLFVHSQIAEQAARDFTDTNRETQRRLLIWLGLVFFFSLGDVNCQTNSQWQMEFLNPETAVSEQSEPFFSLTPITAYHNPKRLFR